MQITHVFADGTRMTQEEFEKAQIVIPLTDSTSKVYEILASLAVQQETPTKELPKETIA